MILDNNGVSFGSCQAIFTYALSMKRAAAKIVCTIGLLNMADPYT